MRLTFATVVAILLAASPASVLQAKPTELASIAVSLVVQETCVIQSTEAAITVANQPAVDCLHGAPFQITQAGFDPVAPIAPLEKSAGAPVELSFLPETRQTTVWTVNF
ncbi:hypothetical protein P3T18_007222 [Paraburkholderia sp. GAS199]|uniref:hypothetical protein n=1 Tax=Paraburkholderia sp. GAS199 TaxID=3035126 RepID=UPI003D2069B1